LLTLLTIAAALYFLPTVIAAARGVNRMGSVFVVNAFLGWTLIGWVGACAMSLGMESRRDYSARINAYQASGRGAPVSSSRSSVPALIGAVALCLVAFSAARSWLRPSAIQTESAVWQEPSAAMTVDQLEKSWVHFHQSCFSPDETAENTRLCGLSDKAAFMLEKQHGICWGPNDAPDEASKGFMPCGAKSVSLVPPDLKL